MGELFSTQLPSSPLFAYSLSPFQLIALEVGPETGASHQHTTIEGCSVLYLTLDQNSLNYLGLVSSSPSLPPLRLVLRLLYLRIAPLFPFLFVPLPAHHP